MGWGRVLVVRKFFDTSNGSGDFGCLDAMGQRKVFRGDRSVEGTSLFTSVSKYKFVIKILVPSPCNCLVYFKIDRIVGCVRIILIGCGRSNDSNGGYTTIQSVYREHVIELVFYSNKKKVYWFFVMNHHDSNNHVELQLKDIISSSTLFTNSSMSLLPIIHGISRSKVQRFLDLRKYPIMS